MSWKLELDNLALGGFAPDFHKETYPSYGNKNQAGAMSNMDLTSPGFMTQGPGLANLTNGTQAAAVTTLIKGITKREVQNSIPFSVGVGGAKVYKITSTTVTSDGDWPHTIDKAAVTAENAQDVVEYGDYVYYIYGHSSSAGDIGRFDPTGTSFDDDWGSTTPTGAAALQGNASDSIPRQLLAAGNNVMYFTNRRYIGSYDGTTFDPQALDFPITYVTQSIQWMSDRLWVAVNNNPLGTAARPNGYIYVWDGAAGTWEQEIKVNGTVGGIYTKNNVLYVFYREQSSTTTYKLAFVDGSGINDLATFTGSLPEHYQISEYKDFLIWNSSGSIYAYGSGHPDTPVRFFQLADGGYATVGGLSCPLGTPLVASTDGGSNFRLAQFSGYDTACTWKSLMFDVADNYKNNGAIDVIRINFETLASGASVAWRLLNRAGTVIYSDTISYAKATASPPLHSLTTAFYPLNGKGADSFRLEFDTATGSTTNPVKLRNAKIYGK